MTRIIGLFLITILLFCGCDKDEDKVVLPLNLYQTQWRGELITKGADGREIKEEILISFQGEGWSNFHIDPEHAAKAGTFQYDIEGKIVKIRLNGILAGNWWASKHRKGTLILKREPNAVTESILNLKRISQ